MDDETDVDVDVEDPLGEKVDTDKSETKDDTEDKFVTFDEDDADDKTDEGDKETDKEDEDTDEEEKKDKKEDEEESDETKKAAVSFKEVKKAYPDIFKKFPQLAAVINRDREMGEVFASIEDAKEAVVDATFFRELESGIMRGEVGQFVKSVGEANPKSLAAFTANLVDFVRDNDDKLYTRLTFPAILEVLKSAKGAGESASNKNLIFAVGHICKYLFNSPEIPEIKTDNGKKDDTIDRERSEFQRERVKDFTDEVTNNGYETMLTEIESKFDPKDKGASPRIKKLLAREVLVEINKQLGTDPRHNRLMDSLFDRAKKANFGRESRRAFIDAYLRAAKAQLPATFARIVSESLKSNKTSKKKEETDDEESNHESAAGNTPSARDIDPRTSDRDILDGKFIPRKRSK